MLVDVFQKDIYVIRQNPIKNGGKMSKLYKIMIIVFFLVLFLGTFSVKSFIIVPDVTGKTINNASVELKDQGLNFNYTLIPTNNSSEIGKVISQDPPGFFVTGRNTPIILTVGQSTKEFQIVDPVNGTSINKQFVIVSGSTDNLKPNENIYVLVQPLKIGEEGNYEWYVQYPVLISGKTWECNAQFGQVVEINRKFRIIAIKTTEKLEIGMYGYKLPDNLNKTDIIEVTRTG